mmetsp:Transcript_15503/g.44117  ORF Transcript_15503/g.44117 Transcript_15503/m.44117 type:complete len:246 (-) Transcript_15503:177-914(-)
MSCTLLSVPGSMRSGFVSTPTVLSPSGSASAANLKASAVAKSALHAQTTSTIDWEGSMKVFDRRLVSSGTSGLCPSVATLAKPGKSTNVSSGAPGAVTRRCTMSSVMPRRAPRCEGLRPGNALMVAFRASPTLSQGPSQPGTPSASTEALHVVSWLLDSLSSIGARVTTPVPRSNCTPEIASKTLDLPADWSPMTTILGKSKPCNCKRLNFSFASRSARTRGLVPSPRNSDAAVVGLTATRVVAA